MIDPCVFKVTLALFSPLIRNHAFDGPSNSMNALLMLLLSLEDLIVLIFSFYSFLSLGANYITLILPLNFVMKYKYNLFISLYLYIFSTNIICNFFSSNLIFFSSCVLICRSHSKNNHEGYGCEGSYPLPP
jgi:hypothetical protein